MIDQHAQHRRNGSHVGDAIALDGLNDAARLEAWQQDDARGRHHGRQANAGRADMEERAGDQHEGVLVEAERRNAGEACRHDVSMAVHHALRLAGAAAGVEEGGEVAIAASGIGDRVGFLHERLVGEQAGGRPLPACLDDVADRRDRGELGCERPMRLVDQQNLGAAIAENAGELGRG
jgi:hypothetical protein